MILLSAQTTVVVTSVVVFLGVIILLVAILLYAKKKLTPSGTVKIDINDGYLEVETEPGNTLLPHLGITKFCFLRLAEVVVLVPCAVARY